MTLVHSGRQRVRDRTVGFVLCTSLVYLAASINQQILGVCAFFVFVIAYYKADRHDGAWVFVLASAAVTLSYVLAFATVKFGVQAPDHRTSISLDLVENLSWFVREPLTNALFLFSFRPESHAFLIVLIFVFCCVVVGGLLCLTGPVRRVAVSILFLACIPLSYAPVLLASENWASYRSAFPLQIYLGGTLFVFVFTLADRFLPRRASTILMIGLPLAAAINWTLLFDAHMRTPYTRESENAQAQILAYFQSPIQNEPGTVIPVLYPRWDEGFVEVMYYDDIGGPIVRVWTAEPLVSLYYEQYRGNPLQADVVPIDFENRDAVLQDARRYIDLTNFAGRSLMKP
jgi:hypothetical protein